MPGHRPRSPSRRAPARLAVVGSASLTLACTAAEPAANPREPATSPERPPVGTGEAELTPPATAEQGLTASDLVSVELSLVDDATRAALGARLGPGSALADARSVLAVRYEIEPDWHIYWTNPGESGLRTRVSLEGRGATPGPVLYPAPERIVAEGGQVSYGWGDAAVLFVPLSGVAEGASFAFTTRYLVCRESCLTGKVERHVELASLPTGVDDTVQAMAARVPEPAGARVSTSWSDGRLRVRPDADSNTELITLYPYASDAAVLGQQVHEDPALVLHYRLNAQPAPDLAQGVLEARVDGQLRWLELAAPWPGA